MNIKRMISATLFVALLTSVIQMPIYAVGNDSYYAAFFRLIFGRIAPNSEFVDQKGQEFADYWSSENDGPKIMAALGIGVASFFLLNWAFSAEKVKSAQDNNKKSNLFSLIFGLLGVLGLKDYANQKMDEGSKDLSDQFGFNMNNKTDADANLNDIGVIGNIALRIANRNNKPKTDAANAPAQQNKPAQQAAPAPQAQQNNNEQNKGGFMGSLERLWNWVFPVNAPAPQAPAAQPAQQPAAPAAPAPAPAAPNPNVNPSIRNQQQAPELNRAGQAAMNRQQQRRLDPGN